MAGRSNGSWLGRVRSRVGLNGSPAIQAFEKHARETHQTLDRTAQLAAQVRDRNNIRLVALTGYGRENDRARARAAGFSHHLTKPVSAAELLELI